MRKIFHLLLGVLTSLTTMTSCLNSDDDDVDVSSYNDVAITAFSLTAVNRYTQSISSKTGNDTVVKTTVSVSAYPMSIDQVNRQIYNLKALPKGSDLAHVVCTISTRNSGVVGLKSLTSDSVTYFSSTDSIDFTQPRVFRVYALNGTSTRDYTVTLNSDGEGSDFTWEQMLLANPTSFAGSKSLRLFCTGDSLVMLSHNADGTTLSVAASADGLTWHHKAAFSVTQLSGAAATGSSLYMLADSQLMRAESLSDWITIATDRQLSLLVGASTSALYALDADSSMVVSTDGGATWTAEALDDSPALLPTEGVASVVWPYAPADETDYVLLAGTRGNQSRSLIWRKIAPWNPAKASQWVYIPYDGAMAYPLPRQSSLSLALHEGTVLALGDDLAIYQSRDQGITWKKNSSLTLPTAATGTYGAIANSDDGTLWVVTDTGQVWRGKKN